MKIRTSLTAPLLLLACLLLATPAPGQPAATVAAWNIGGFHPIPDSRVRNIARAINVIKPDVIALTEVNPASSQDPAQTVLQRIVDRLDEDYWFLYFPENARQNIALLYRDGVGVTDDELIPGTDLGNPGLRRALAARVRVHNFDFIIVAVHPKAGRDSAARESRTRPARPVANYIRGRTAGAEKDVLLVGDYDMIPGEDRVNFSAVSPGSGGDEFLRFILSEALAGMASHISGCGPLRGNLLDGFAISAAHTGEYVTDSLRLLSLDDPAFAQPGGAPVTCVNYRGFISDHFLLVARFRATSDDD